MNEFAFVAREIELPGQTKEAPPLSTYPARPIQGGRLELAPSKRGVWYVEPKLNGWRTLIHTPSGLMWNRHGTTLSIADCFRPALSVLATLAARGLVWADCEALQRRHKLGRGTLIVLDTVPESSTPTYEERRALLESLLSPIPLLDGDLSKPVPFGSVALMPTHLASQSEALTYYRRLRTANRLLQCDFFEGVVMKRGDSPYPVQLRSPTEEYRGWVKHRFLT